MRFRLVLILLLASSAIAGQPDQFNSSKPGYQIAKAIDNLLVHRNAQYLENLRHEAKYASSTKEADLSTLAADFIGCALSVEGNGEKCRLKGKLSRYGYYEPLATRLNQALGTENKRLGLLFKCAIEELQETITHTQYIECIDLHPPYDR